MIDFAVLPPEINSARMYAGAGAGPLVTASTSWSLVATSLYESAAAIRTTVTGLAAVWMGPSALAMQQAASRYASWMMLTAAHAETTANQARAAVAAYEAAFVGTVPPPVVAANRALLAALVATNFLGINTASIMATEAQYVEMWAQDAATMYEYAAASAAATRLPQFTPAPQVAHPAAALQSATAGIPGTVQQILSGLLGGETLPGFINQTFQSFLSSGGPFDIPLQLLSLFTVLWGVTSPSSPLAQAILNSPSITTPEVVVPPLMPAPTAGAAPSTTVTSVIGNGNRIGLLRVPPDWARPVPSPSPVTPLPAAPPTDEIPMPMPMPIGAPRGGTPMKQEKPQPEYGLPVRFIPRPPAGG